MVCPRRPFSSSVDSARSAADAAATGNSPPQPKPKSACAAVTKAKTACAEGPSAAVSSIPAAGPGHASAVDCLAAAILYRQSSAGLHGSNTRPKSLQASTCTRCAHTPRGSWTTQVQELLTYEHDARSGNRAPFAANLVHNEAQADHASKQAGHLGIVQRMQEGAWAVHAVLQAPTLCRQECRTLSRPVAGECCVLSTSEGRGVSRLRVSLQQGVASWPRMTMSVCRCLSKSSTHLHSYHAIGCMMPAWDECMTA